jgi:hypothetical protein
MILLDVLRRTGALAPAKACAGGRHALVQSYATAQPTLLRGFR